jgi:hypothetical protein
MRILLLMVMLAVCAPAVWAQSASAADAEAPKLTEREAKAILLAPLSVERLPSDDQALPARRDRAPEGEARADRADDFLYHILYTVVGALVTALIWKAVFD